MRFNLGMSSNNLMEIITDGTNVITDGATVITAEANAITDAANAITSTGFCSENIGGPSRKGGVWIHIVDKNRVVIAPDAQVDSDIAQGVRTCE